MSDFVRTRPQQLIHWDSIPKGLNTRFSAVCHSLKDCEDLAHRFHGIDFYPEYGPMLPVLLLIPGAPQQIAGWGLSEPEELRDQAVAVWELITERLRKTGSTFDFDSAREKHGLLRREDVDSAIREAMVDRVKKHKANPVTDPPREPNYVRPNERTTFAQPQSEDWKDNSDA